MELDPPPFWLNPALEIRAEDEPPKPKRGEFVVRSAEILQHLGCALEGALNVVSNSCVETGWGQRYRGNNLGGWKASKQNSTRQSQWWRAAGHVEGGDAPTCFYRAFPSYEQFYAEWLQRFVPKPGSTTRPRYLKTGAAFWAGGDWFAELVRAGYKGVVTQAHPDKTLHEFAAVLKEVREFWGQHVLDVPSDGAWGPRTQEAMKGWQHGHGLEPSGVLDEASTAKMFPDSPAARIMASGKARVAPRVINVAFEDAMKVEDGLTIQVPDAQPPPRRGTNLVADDSKTRRKRGG